MEALALVLSASEAQPAEPVILVNDQGNLAKGSSNIQGACSRPLYYCGKSESTTMSLCGIDEGRQQCQSCSRLQQRADRLLDPLHPLDLAEIRGKETCTEFTRVVVALMTAHRTAVDIQAWGCLAIKKIAGLNAAEVIPNNALGAVLAALEEHKWNARVLTCGMHTLVYLLGGSGGTENLSTTLAISSVTLEKVQNIIDLVTEVQIVNRRDEDLQLMGCQLLFLLSQIPENCTAISAGWGMEAIIRAMHDNSKPGSGMQKLSDVVTQRSGNWSLSM